MYRIRGVNHAGFSPYSYVTVSAPYDPTVIPPAPTLYNASPFTDTSTTIHWGYVPQAWGYLVEFKTGSSGWIQITNVSVEVTSTRHENLSPSTEYTYRVRAYNGAGESAYSAEASTSTYPPPPSSPDLRGFPVSYKEIELRWTDVLTNCCGSPGYIGYRLEAWNGNAWSDLHFAGVDDTNYFVNSLQPSTEYTYRIVALHPLASVWSTNTVRTMDPPPIPPPTAPVFYADPYSAAAVQLKWLDVYLETEYRIERENFPGGGVWQQIAAVPANTTSYRDIDLQPGTTYVYRIRAANTFGASDYSHEAAATTPVLPEFPVVQAGPLSSTSVLLIGRRAEGAVSYQLQRLNRSGEWDVLFETNTAPFRFEDTGLTPSTPYTYRVAARQDGRAPAWAYSAEVTTQTFPPQFSASGRALSPGSIELSWPALPYAEHIYILPLTNGVWVWPPIELDGTATNYVIAGLTPNTTYTYQVYGYYSIGTRTPEVQVAITTPGSISGDIVITSILPAAGTNFRLRLTGSTGQRFKVQSTGDFQSWTDRTEPLALTADMDVLVPSVGNAAFYRTIKVD
jgi:titin